MGKPDEDEQRRIMAKVIDNRVKDKDPDDDRD